MQNTDPRVTAYIQNAAPFAQPILTHLRQIIHAACPEVTETIKWQFPNFDYNGIVCSMAAFKNHCTFSFWKASSLSDPHKLFTAIGNTAMGQFGQIKSLTDLPSDAILTAYIQEAAKLNKEKVKGAPRTKPTATPELLVPEYLLEALTQNEKAQHTFEKFSYSHKKEYVSWITEAKSEETRQKRINTALEWMAEGKGRNWKYQKK
ncbi:MAG: YdeI/OmpD-associated family protein [Adhaeribacter sp.]